MTLPDTTHAIFSTLQGAQNPDTKPTLQRAKNANAQPLHPSSGNAFALQIRANSYKIPYKKPWRLCATRHTSLNNCQYLNLH